MLSLTDLKESLQKVDQLQFRLPDGSPVPSHFHITEAGLITKHFIDCGGTIRKEYALTMQIWYSVDYNHRLSPEKFLKILDKAEPLLENRDLPIEIEYQTDTIGKYNLEFNGMDFLLLTTKTDCLAKETCAIKPESEHSDRSKKHSVRQREMSVCIPGGGCC